ncbi:putative bifunctional diguanylate cyclase/phosphodiesterase [Xylophilus ampelinus]|uniref:Diguanylate cyclase/phosphodiesterase with PAS/PAC sensor(S) n=1 Tax=Xylophilus ampelinus TaxID=54067 RepID=A0A318SEM5_9BURK|nr:EAL domain-containing protein [Xylophilus ampelinus]MCS4511402.1 EAL domain-containing protein [Xylophilus ampelinus]PYE75855.1 diguanylate cyclase/phosphodiesterase with PAS/PAC sensor(s) [Xylophilus ampelinus]
MKQGLRPVAVAALYIVVGAAWMFASQRLQRTLDVTDPALVARLHGAGEFVFVVLTGLLGWVLLRRERRAREASLRIGSELGGMVQHAGVGIGRMSVDFRMLAASPRLCEIFGRSEADLVGRSMAELMESFDAAAAQERRGILLRGEAHHYEIEHRIRHTDGQLRWLKVKVGIVRDEDDVPAYFVPVVEDVTAMRSAQTHLRLADAIIEETVEGVMVTDADQRIVSVNPAFSRVSGYAAAEVLGELPRLLQSGRHAPDFYAAMWADLDAHGRWQGEVWNRRKSGEIFPEMLAITAVRDGAGHVNHYVGVFTDITLQKASEAKLDYLAHHDALTGLPNRLMFQLRLEEVVLEAEREGEMLAVLLFDLDRFKDVNDSYGHLAGDELLQQVAARLGACRRPTDVLARLGGDEFALLMRDLPTGEDAASGAARCMEALAQPWHSRAGVELATGMSAGICLFPQHGTTPEALLQGADAALYRAKGDGRGVYRYFADEMTASARARLELEAKLRRAVAQGTLQLHYQPQVDIGSGRIVGAEALLRWQDPEAGRIPPDRFIPVAESTGLIGAIGTWVLAETCRQGRAWRDEGLPPLTLAANVSPRQFHLNDVVGQATQVLEATGFPADCLELEITEGVLVEREDEALDTLEQLRALGVRIAIDDFGTGYSSLAKLKRFPIDVIKIDRSFIGDIPGSADDMAISAAIIAMARSLGMRVIAEGVETKAQLDFLRERHCDMYQGFLLSHALPPDEFAALLRRQPALLEPAGAPARPLIRS